MLKIIIPAEEQWDAEKEEFVYHEKDQVLELEHSLVSLSKWESKWCKSFIETKEKTFEESIDYIKCMTLTRNVDPEIYNRLTVDNIREINEYIESPMTATWFNEQKRSGGGKKEVLTAELIYYSMIAYGIPFECQKWHLNRLLTLIRVCNLKNEPPKKMSKQETMRNNAALNAARRKKLNTKG